MEAENGGKSRDISTALDGTWQKRGHVSQNGVVTAISVPTGKELDVQIMSKHCRCLKGLKKNTILTVRLIIVVLAEAWR